MFINGKFCMDECEKIHMAVAITEAFQAKMNMAPAPNNNENKRQKIKT